MKHLAIASLALSLVACGQAADPKATLDRLRAEYPERDCSGQQIDAGTYVWVCRTNEQRARAFEFGYEPKQPTPMRPPQLPQVPAP